MPLIKLTKHQSNGASVWINTDNIVSMHYCLSGGYTAVVLSNGGRFEVREDADAIAKEAAK